MTAAGTSASTPTPEALAPTGATTGLRGRFPRSQAPARPPVKAIVALAVPATLGLLLLALLGEVSGHVLLIPSMAASMALIVATPHAPLAQPRAVVLGHSLAVVIGIVLGLISHSYWMGALAVGLSLTAMLVTRCAHPPATATAVLAVLATEAHLSMLVCTVLAALILVGVGLLRARLTTGHEYPAYWW